MSSVIQTILSLIFDDSSSLTSSTDVVSSSVSVSKYAIGLGVMVAVADACLQGTVLFLEPYICPAREGEKEGHWDTTRTFRAFVYASTGGLVLSVVRLIFYDKESFFGVILPQMIPGELLLLPFQYVVYRQEEAHLTRNVAYYMLVFTLLNLTIYIPTYVVTLFWESTVVEAAATVVEQMWLGITAVSLLMFFNRYYQWQWRLPLPDDASKALRWGNSGLIYSAQIFGNLSVLFLTTSVIIGDTADFPFLPTLPLWFAQILVNSQFQLARDKDVQTTIKVLRIASTVLAIPACNLQISNYFPSLTTFANVLAFSAFSLWIGTFNKEWKQLYDEIEGEDPFDPVWPLDSLLDFPFTGLDIGDFIRKRVRPEGGMTDGSANDALALEIEGGTEQATAGTDNVEHDSSAEAGDTQSQQAFRPTPLVVADTKAHSDIAASVVAVAPEVEPVETSRSSPV